MLFDVKNRIIVGALRDQLDFDRQRSLADARAALQRVAAQLRADGDRARSQARRARLRLGRSRHEHDYHPGDVEHLQARHTLYHAVADALLSRLGKPDALRELVEEARASAWEEISQELSYRLTAVAYAPEEAGRDDRLRAFREELPTLLVDLQLRD